MSIDKIDRRIFLKTSGAAGLIALGSGVIMAPDGAWAMALAKLDEPTATALVRLTRDLYPHDAVDDGAYAKVVEALDQEAGKDAAAAQTLADGVKALNTAAGGKYAAADEAKRLAVLTSMQNDAFVQKVRGAVINNFYNDPAVWKKLGYEGSSAEHGGYLTRGFDDLAWLPKS
jgi:hypothetical protein